MTHFQQWGHFVPSANFPVRDNGTLPWQTRWESLKFCGSCQAKLPLKLANRLLRSWCAISEGIYPLLMR